MNNNQEQKSNSTPLTVHFMRADIHLPNNFGVKSWVVRDDPLQKSTVVTTGQANEVTPCPVTPSSFTLLPHDLPVIQFAFALSGLSSWAGLWRCCWNDGGILHTWQLFPFGEAMTCIAANKLYLPAIQRKFVCDPWQIERLFEKLAALLHVQVKA
jgi:hypothetical protein